MTDLAKALSEGNGEKALTATLGDVVVMNSAALEASTRAEVDMQVATAKQYPRDLQQVLKNIEFLATQDQETAESCFYAIKRDGKTIMGATVRLAEIISSQWGNMRSQAKIIANDGKTITAKGECWDLETNVAYAVEVRRKITTSTGQTYSEDMQIVSANAACSIALRNAVFKCIPMAITRKIQEKIKDVMLGDEESFEGLKEKALTHFLDELKVTEKELLTLLEIESLDDITKDDVFLLRGIATAIVDGDTTVHQTFRSKKATKKKGLSSRLDIGEEEEPETEIVEEAEVVVEKKDKKTASKK